MAKRAHNPYIPVSDEERLRRAEHILKAAIVAMDAKYVNTYTLLQPGKSVHIDLAFPMEAAHSLIEEVIAHRRDRKKVIAKRAVPDRSPLSITRQLLQILHLLKVTICATETEPDPADGMDFSYPLNAIVNLIDRVHDELYEEDDNRFFRDPKVMREMEVLRAGAKAAGSGVEAGTPAGASDAR